MIKAQTNDIKTVIIDETIRSPDVIIFSMTTGFPLIVTISVSGNFFTSLKTF
jgi:hypothetical protein